MCSFEVNINFTLRCVIFKSTLDFFCCGIESILSFAFDFALSLDNVNCTHKKHGAVKRHFPSFPVNFYQTFPVVYREKKLTAFGFIQIFKKNKHVEEVILLQDGNDRWPLLAKKSPPPVE